MLLNNPPGGKNRISKNVAYLLHARVALYEATWENIIVVQLLYREEADGRVKMRKVMMLMWKLIISLMKRLLLRSCCRPMVGNLAENTDTPEGMNASLVSINPYYTMFCDENMEGYKEILMWKNLMNHWG